MVADLIPFILQGILLGLILGITPGPFFVLIVRETITHGWRRGMPLAWVPFLTDGPIMLLSILFVSAITFSQTAISVLGVIGAGVLGYLAFETLRVDPHAAEKTDGETRTRRKNAAFAKALLTNFSNPHLYIYYFTAGSAIFIRAKAQGTSALVAFAVSFLAVLALSQVAIVLLAHHARRYATGKAYVWTLRALGFALLLFAAQLGWEAVRPLLA